MASARPEGPSLLLSLCCDGVGDVDRAVLLLEVEDIERGMGGGGMSRASISARDREAEGASSTGVEDAGAGSWETGEI